MIWRMFMAVNCPDNCHYITNTRNFTLKQMFDISARLVSEQDEISGLETIGIGWENSLWKYLSLIGDERIVNLQRTKVYIFSDSVLCLGKIFEKTNIQRCMGAQIRVDQIFSKLQKLWQNRWWANGIRVEYFPRIQHVAAQWRSQKFTVRIRRNTRTFHRKSHIHVDIQRHFLWNKRQWRRTSGKCSTSIFVCKKIWKRTMVIHWSWFWENGPKLQKGCCWNSLRADVQFSVLRLHCPEVNSKAKYMVNCRYTLQPTRKRLRLCIEWLLLHTSSVFTEQSKRYVKNTNPFTKERGDLMLWWGNQSCSVRSRQKFLWRVMTQNIRIFYDNNLKNELRSSHNKTKREFCLDAGFLSAVENEYYMTKDTGDLTQFNTVVCREFTLPIEVASQPKGSIQGNTKIGLVLEVATSYLHGKHGVEVRIMSLSRDNTHSWVRISYGTNLFVMNLNNETEILEDQLEEYACKRFCMAGSSPKIVPIERRNWIEIEPGKYSLSECEVSKKVIYLLRHSQEVHREEDGAVRFWRMMENLQKHFPYCHHWFDCKWKKSMAGGGARRRYQYCTDDWGTIVYFRALQGHSGRNFIDPLLQDNVVIQSGFFQHIYHIGCAFNLHSIINSGSIIGGQNSNGRQAVFFLPVDPVDKSTKILKWLTRMYHVMHNTCTMHGRDIKTQYIGST